MIVAFAVWWAAAQKSNGDVSVAAGLRPIAALKVPDVHALVIDPTNPDHLLFGSHAGLQESDDGGFTWRDGSLSGADAMNITASRATPAAFYIAGHDVFEVSYDGKKWRPMPSKLPGTDIHAFAQSPLDPARLFASVAGQGVFNSSDGGASWTALTAQPPGGEPIALASNGTALYAATQNGVQISRDQGLTWIGLAAQPGSTISVAVTVVDPNLIYAGTTTGLFKSGNGGQSWTQVARATAVAAVALSADAARVLFVTDHGAVFRSDDGGATWLAPK